MKKVSGLPANTGEQVVLDMFEGFLEIDQNFCGVLVVGRGQLCPDGGPPGAISDPTAGGIVALGGGVVGGPQSDFSHTGLLVESQNGPE
jgi:hypothetical protein